MTSEDSAGRLAELIYDALQNPEIADKNGMLTAASAFLDVVKAGDEHLVPLARSMAFTAMDFAFFDRPEHHTALANRFKAFSMAYTAIKADADQ